MLVLKTIAFLWTIQGLQLGCLGSLQCTECPGLGRYCNDGLFAKFFLPKCPANLGIHMQVYTRSNRNSGQPITRDSIPSVFRGSRMTMYIVHGFMSNENANWMHEMKKAVLDKVDYNVIIVGWKSGANPLDYSQSASNTRTVGGEIALVNKKTISNGGSSRARQYCVGHSLGAHVCGHAGKQGQFGRITGLDPAGPEFENHDWSVGLNPSCADYVDVIHTNGFSLTSEIPFGTRRHLGHVDFYPNGGGHQPGCSIFAVACSHGRAYDYFTESIRTGCFYSRNKCTNEYILPLLCPRSSSPVQSLGFNSRSYSARGIFYLETNSKSPYCKN